MVTDEASKLSSLSYVYKGIFSDYISLWTKHIPLPTKMEYLEIEMN